MQNPGEASLEAACRDHWRPSGASWVQLETIWRQLETIWGQLEAIRRPLEAIWEPKWQIISLFTTNRHINPQMCPFLHAFMHLVPLNFTFIQLFTYQSPLFKNAIKHQFLHAFVQCHYLHDFGVAISWVGPSPLPNRGQQK